MVQIPSASNKSYGKKNYINTFQKIDSMQSTEKPKVPHKFMNKQAIQNKIPFQNPYNFTINNLATPPKRERLKK
jgi:hypothetical protein